MHCNFYTVKKLLLFIIHNFYVHNWEISCNQAVTNLTNVIHGIFLFHCFSMEDSSQISSGEFKYDIQLAATE